ncbi:MAG: DUF763 domain-containing protein [Candidatus Aenigmatarchaeota archaeon]|nr:MAG: hypothetical protein B6U68_00100 [Candidatus Aenigmarchaeota archaeon ex4484_14]RLI97131.1 MAG: DUF763 domain-containing protein [Candidatus Aenigmarchaeota archaeon]
MRRTGVANLPLHVGRAPRWLFERMVRLSKAISETIIYEYGQEELLRRMSDPFWFQALSCVIGFDWHSSGTTTTTCGALKIALSPQEHGIAVLGGKGKTSRKTPQEIEKAGDIFSLSSKKINEIVYASKMSAKVDNSCVQDGYQLYHHTMLLSEKGNWAVVQQGMNDRYARRYHWLSDSVNSFVEEPHTGICADHMEQSVLNMTSKQSKEARKASVDLVRGDVKKIKKFLTPSGQAMLADFCKRLDMPAHHAVVLSKRDYNVLKQAYEINPNNYEELVALHGIGPKRIRALALISSLIYGTEPSWRDPAKYSFAHGGKDGHPYPVDRDVYDSSIQTLRDAIKQAKLGQKDKISAIRRLESFIS